MSMLHRLPLLLVSVGGIYLLGRGGGHFPKKNSPQYYFHKSNFILPPAVYMVLVLNIQVYTEVMFISVIVLG